MVDQKLVLGPRRGLAQQRLELGEQLLDRVEVGRVGRQLRDLGPDPASASDALVLVRGQVVEHDHVPRGRAPAPGTA